LIEAEKTFGEGMKIENFRNSSQEKLHKNLKNSPDATKIRAFLKEEFDNIFIDK
jgi:hypothetical protein